MTEKIEKRLPYNVFLSGPRKGQCKTIQDRIIRYLVNGLDCIEIESKTKRRAFCKKGQSINKYYVGKNGAVRCGKNHTTSVDVASIIKRKMEIWEMKKEEEINKKEGEI